MKILNYKDSSFESDFKGILATSSLFDREIEKRVQGIIDAVRERGDQALIDFAEQFDKVTLNPERIRVSKEEILAAALKVRENKEVYEAMLDAHKNIEKFSKKACRKNWMSTNAHGAKVGEKFDPFHRVGVYVPAGKAPLASTALMTVTLAAVAGCRKLWFVLLAPKIRPFSRNSFMQRYLRVLPRFIRSVAHRQSQRWLLARTQLAKCRKFSVREMLMLLRQRGFYLAMWPLTCCRVPVKFW